MAEPFAWYRYQQGERVYYDSKKWEDCQPLYTHPKDWVGLTEEDFSAINQSCFTKLQAATSAESILKEKNNG